MERLFQLFNSERFERLTALANLLDLVLVLALVVTAFGLCLSLGADAQVRYPYVSTGHYR